MNSLLAEQNEIVRILDNLLENEQQAREFYNVIEKIGLIKKLFLLKVLHGELETNGQEEESAVELIKEILKQKI